MKLKTINVRCAAAMLGAASVLLAPALRANDVIKQQLEFYNTKIAPVMAEKCYKCHSGTEDKVKGGLTLDTKEGMLRGGDTGPSVVPGNPEKSLLIRAIAYADEDLQMPPKEKLPSHVIADFVVWIKMGAPVPQAEGTTAKSYKNAAAANHWAFKPVTKPAVPSVTAQQWVRNEIDNFLLAKLEAKNMYPNKLADKRTLIRRATFDLTGLPPTPEEVKAFLADNSSGAYEKLIDRLLASPQYGERWGRYWLDVARYADTKGEVNGQREDFHYPYAYTYRDYVIKAFNDDKPYDQFIMEQLAADRLDLKDKSTLAALGFITLGNRFDNNQNEIINDRIDTVTKGFQALTVACSRCHDHMFDPLPTEDYYALHGIFSSSVEPREKPLIDKVNEKSPEYQSYLTERAKLENDLQDFYREDVGKFISDLRKNSGLYLGIIEAIKGKDRSEMGKLVRQYKLNQEAARLWQNILTRTRRGYDPVMGPYHEFARFSEKDFATKAKDLVTRITNNSDRKKPVNPYISSQFRGRYVKSMSDVVTIYGRAFAMVEANWQQVSSRNADAKALPDAGQEAVRRVVFAGGNPNDDPIDAIRRALPRNLQGRETRLRSAISQLEGSHPGAPERAMAINDSQNPRDSYVFIRGESGSRGPVVPRRYLEIFSEGKQPFRDGSGRLELARAIASKENPLTARVMVNRIWMHHFGDGLVLTPDDFGTQSTPPSHPELLDHLASDFMQNGWSVKTLHKKIMMTYAYQQSSENNPQFAQLDPYNRLLWRANIRRLEFEALRDSLLAMGGKLDTTMGGKPVNLMSEPYSTRRTVYGYIDRARLPEVMNSFDFANPDITTGKRYETIVPQQSLFMMNSPLVVEQARNLTERADFKGLTDDEERIKLLYELIFQRLPSETEIKLGLAFLNSTPAKDLVPVVANVQQVAQANPKAKAKGKAAVRPATPPKPVVQKTLGAWDKYAHALLQTNEATFVN